MTKEPKLRSSYVPHDRVVTDVGGPSMTRQEFADECDVNALMARYEKSGIWPMPLNAAPPRYLDVSAVPDLQTAMQYLIEADIAFMSLPAVVRREFDNDAVKFVDFAQKPENIGRMREWGLAEPEKAPDAPMRVEVVNPAPAPGGAPTQ